MSDTPETHEAVERWRQGKINIFDEMARLETERDQARQQERIHYDNFLSMQDERDKAERELELLLESTKVETCAEPLPERDGEPADFAGAITRMRLAEEERNQWRECAEERKKAWYEMQSAFERSRDEVNALERERDQWRECAKRLDARLRKSNDWTPSATYKENQQALAEFEKLKEASK